MKDSKLGTYYAVVVNIPWRQIPKAMTLLRPKHLRTWPKYILGPFTWITWARGWGFGWRRLFWGTDIWFNGVPIFKMLIAGLVVVMLGLLAWR